MDTRTGKIYMFNSDASYTDLQNDLIEIDMNDATEKQKIGRALFK